MRSINSSRGLDTNIVELKYTRKGITSSTSHKAYEHMKGTLGRGANESESRKGKRVHDVVPMRWAHERIPLAYGCGPVIASPLMKSGPREEGDCEADLMRGHLL